MNFITTAQPIFYSDYGVAYLDPQLSKYYYSLIPQYINKQQQKYPPHVTFLRKEKEKIPNLTIWKKFINDGCNPVIIMYNGRIRYSGSYFFLDAWSHDLMMLRLELGLTPYRKGFSKFHITIGNLKDV